MNEEILKETTVGLLTVQQYRKIKVVLQDFPEEIAINLKNKVTVKKGAYGTEIAEIKVNDYIQVTAVYKL